MATELHDGDLFSDFILLAAEVIGDGQMWPRARYALPLQLVETVGARIVARHDLDSLHASSKAMQRKGRGRGGGSKENRGEIKRKEQGKKKTHDFDTILREIPAFVYGAVLALTHGGPAEVMI